jgi:hypothetical protein
MKTWSSPMNESVLYMVGLFRLYEHVLFGEDGNDSFSKDTTDSLERRGTMTSVPARERVPLPDANQTD